MSDLFCVECFNFNFPFSVPFVPACFPGPSPSSDRSLSPQTLFLSAAVLLSAPLILLSRFDLFLPRPVRLQTTLINFLRSSFKREKQISVPDGPKVNKHHLCPALGSGSSLLLVALIQALVPISVVFNLDH